MRAARSEHELDDATAPKPIAARGRIEGRRRSSSHQDDRRRDAAGSGQDPVMAMRLVALGDGQDILVNRPMVIVGRHPQCDAFIDSIRVSRRHCCMTVDHDEVVVRDLGSTNGVRINGRRVEEGRLRPGDELSIAHFRYRLQVETESLHRHEDRPEPASLRLAGTPPPAAPHVLSPPSSAEGELAAAVRRFLPTNVGDPCLIQVIVQPRPNPAVIAPDEAPGPGPVATPEEAAEACPSDSSR